MTKFFKILREDFGPLVLQNLDHYIIKRAPRATAMYFTHLYMGNHNAKRNSIYVEQQVFALDWDMEMPLMNVVNRLEELVRDKVPQYSGEQKLARILHILEEKDDDLPKVYEALKNHILQNNLNYQAALSQITHADGLILLRNETNNSIGKSDCGQSNDNQDVERLELIKANNQLRAEIAALKSGGKSSGGENAPSIEKSGNFPTCGKCGRNNHVEADCWSGLVCGHCSGEHPTHLCHHKE